MLELEQDAEWAHQETLGTREDDIHEGMTNAAEFLRQSGITYNRRSKAFKKLGNLFSKAAYEAAQKSLRYWQGKPYQPTDPMFASSPGNTASNAHGTGIAKKMTFRALLDEYMKDPDAPRSLSTRKNYIIIHRVLEELLGADKFAHEITRDDVKGIRDLLRNLPSNATKLAPNKTLQEACALAAQHRWPLIAPATVNLYLSKLNAVLSFAKREKYVHENEAIGIAVHDEVKKKDKRTPFNPEHLQKIFSAPLYTAKKKKDQRTSTQFWIPLLGLFTGMRLNEICQLELADIIRVGTIDVILVQEESATGGKKIKTAYSSRRIPIHPELKKLGFIDYVAKIKEAGNARLFPDLEKDSQGYYSGNFSKWFNRTFLNSAKVKQPKISFHSFRHNFRDALRIAEAPYEVVGQLGGWVNGNTRDDYGEGLPVDVLFKSLRKVGYKGLDLSHLYVKKS